MYIKKALSTKPCTQQVHNKYFFSDACVVVVEVVIVVILVITLILAQIKLSSSLWF